jgi:hypothetical protein
MNANAQTDPNVASQQATPKVAPPKLVPPKLVFIGDYITVCRR